MKFILERYWRGEVTLTELKNVPVN
ncbi:hypothetical protein [Shewanella frigidimarina]